MRSSCLVVLSLTLAGAGGAAVACGGSGTLKSPTSDKVADDPCDPGNGGTGGTSLPPVDAGATLVAVPGGSAGVGFDDLRFSGTLSLVLVPGGRTGNLDTIDPASRVVSSIGGFSSADTYSGDDTFGVTSADEGNAIIYATDRTAKKLYVIDPKKRAIVSSVALAGTPGYVRWVQPATEVWVTEPDLHQIEVFKPGATAATAPSSTGTIAVPDGPESLEIDADHKRAFTHATAATVEIDVTSHAVTQSWPNGCTNSRGIAVDSANGWVMSACEEGRVVVLDTNSGATIGTVSVGAGVDQITYDTKRTRLYVPGAASSSTSVVQLAANGSPTAKGAVSTSSDAHCAVTGGAGQVFVCSPAQGALLFVNDPF